MTRYIMSAPLAALLGLLAAPASPRRNRVAKHPRCRQSRFESLEQRFVLATITVSPGLDTLVAAVNAAHSGDTLSLKPGVYPLSHTLEIAKNLKVKGSSLNADQVHIAPIEEGFIGDHIISVLSTASKA